MTQDRKARTDGNRQSDKTNAQEEARTGGSTGAEQERGGEKQRSAQAGQSGRNVPNEPLPDLSEQGGVEPLEDDPADYNDRTRDRELDEG